MKVLVTGGAGYIGSHAVDLLVKRGYEVVVFDNLSTGHRESLPGNVDLIVGDLQDRAQVAAAFDAHAFDGIMHFASYTLVGESTEKPWLYLRDNVVAASNLLEVAVNHNVGRFILSSTANLFDAPMRIPIDANERIVPGSPYGESKAMIERMLHWMDTLYGLKYCCLRYFNAAGAHPDGHIGEHHDIETHLIPLVLQVALGQRETFTIYGDDYPTPDGTCVRDFVHVVDLAEAHVLALEALADGQSRKYNLGAGAGISVREVVELAKAVTERPIQTRVGARRMGDPAVLVADSTAIQRELGWRPRHSDLEQILETAWNWHRTHPNGYR